MTFEIDLCPLFSAYFHNYSIKISKILARKNRHTNTHFSFRKYFKIRIGKLCNRTSKMVHVQFCQNRASPMTFGRRNVHIFLTPAQNFTFFISLEPYRKIEEHNAGKIIYFLTKTYILKETFSLKIFKTGDFRKGQRKTWKIKMKNDSNNESTPPNLI